MTADAILTDLWRDGISVSLTPDGEHLAVPAGRPNPDQRAIILTHKPKLSEAKYD